MYEVQFSSVCFIRRLASSSEVMLNRAMIVLTRTASAARRNTCSAPGKSRRMYAPPRPTITTLPVRAASSITFWVMFSTALRVSNAGPALGGVQAVVSVGIKGSVVAAPSATRSRASREPGCSSSASTSSLGPLDPPRRLIDNRGVEEVARHLLGQHAPDGRPASPKLPPDRNDRHGTNSRPFPWAFPLPFRGEGQGEGRTQKKGLRVNERARDARRLSIGEHHDNAYLGVRSRVKRVLDHECERRSGWLGVEAAQRLVGAVEVPEDLAALDLDHRDVVEPSPASRRRVDQDQRVVGRESEHAH